MNLGVLLSSPEFFASTFSYQNFEFTEGTILFCRRKSPAAMQGLLGLQEAGDGGEGDHRGVGQLQLTAVQRALGFTRPAWTIQH